MCLEALGQSAREAIDLRYRLQLRMAEIGARLKRSEGAVKLLVHRARAALRHCLDRKAEEGSMTDAELIELIQQKTPDELTPEEIELLRSRLAESHELRELLIGQLQMETYLMAALGRVNLTPEQIVARAQKVPETGSAGVLIVLGLLIFLPLATLIGAVVMNAMRAGERAARLDKPALAPEGADREGEAAGPNQRAEPADKPEVSPNPLRDAILAAQGKPPIIEQPVQPRVRDLQPPAKTKDKPAAPAAPAPLPWQAAMDQAGSSARVRGGRFPVV